MSDQELTMILPARRCYQNGKGGTVHVGFIDNVGKIMDGDEQIGEVRSVIGGGVEIRRTGGDTFYIDPLDFWAAFEQAEGPRGAR